MKMNETLACKLSIMRKLYGKSLVEFAEEIDVSKTTLQNIEAGKANLTLNMVETIANRLGISPMALISDEYDARHLYTAKLFLCLNRSFVTWCARGQSSTPSGKAKSILFSLLSWKSKTTTRQVGPICWPPLTRSPFFISAFRSYSVYRLLEVKISTMILSGLRDSSMITFQHGVGHLILI